MGVVTVLWVLYGYSLAFGNDVGNLFGDPTQYFGLKGLIGGNAAAAVIADPQPASRRRRGRHPAGRHASRDRLRRVPADVRDHHRRADHRRDRRPREVRRLAGLRRPVGDVRLLPGRALGVRVRRRHRARRGGWIANKLKAIDFAGGTAVHINAGAAGLVLASSSASASAGRATPMRPHNLPFVMLGAGLLWFGWFGFNAGSAIGSGGIAGVDVRHHHGRHRGRDARLAAHGADPRRQRHLAGCRLGHRRRPGRDHPVLLVGERRSARSSIGVVAGVLCALAVGLKYSSASTTRSTWSACTWSAASSARC